MEEGDLECRFDKSNVTTNQTADEFGFSSNVKFNSEKSKHKAALLKAKNKLKRFKREYKCNKGILIKINNLLKLTNNQLKLTRSISIPRIRGKPESLNSNILYSNETNQDTDGYKPNPDTFRKIETDRGFESQVSPSNSIPNVIKLF